MAYPILQLLNLLTDDRYILKLIYCKPILQPFLGGIVQTSHSPIIFSATPIASFINGTGMRDAADSNNIKACLPVAVIYFAVVGMTSRGFSDDSWIQMCVREMGGYTSINPLTAALIFVSITSSSTEVNTFVAETISCCSGRSWTQFFCQEHLHDLTRFIAHLRFRLRNFKFPRNEQTTPGETSRRHSC